jgi:hypothetical protein
MLSICARILPRMVRCLQVENSVVNTFSQVKIVPSIPAEISVPKPPIFNLVPFKGNPKPGKRLEAKIENIFYSVHKLNCVATAIRKKEFLDAINIVNVSDKKGALYVKKLLEKVKKQAEIKHIDLQSLIIGIAFKQKRSC